MSVSDTFVREVEVGNIWNNDHARQIAHQYMKQHPEVDWTGQWKSVTLGKQAIIQVSDDNSLYVF